MTGKRLKKYWFKAKNYGWGWYPATIEGWLVTGIFVGIITYRSSTVNQMLDSGDSFVARFFVEVMFYTLLLLAICFKTGEKPGWRWGGKNRTDK